MSLTWSIVTRLMCVAVAVLCPFAPSAAAAAAAAAIYDLGSTVPPQSHGFAINAARQVAGESHNNNSSLVHAFRYDGTPGAGGVMRDLGTLGGTSSFAYGVNASGQVVGRAHTNISFLHAFRYDGTPGAGGVMRDLGALGGNTTTSRAEAINDAGQVVGQSSTRLADTHAFLYIGTPGAGGIMHDLGTLGGFDSAAQGINNAGQVVGYSNPVGNNIVHAFLYEGIPGAGGVMRDLGTLGGENSNANSNAKAINDIGQVTGFSSTSGSLPTNAFRYDPLPGGGGVMHDLGTLGGLQCIGYDVNNLGVVVGYSELPSPFNLSEHAFIYTGTPGVDGQMIDLDSWLDANNPTEGAKWSLSAAHGITDTGWITGVGGYDADGPGGPGAAIGRAFLLDASALVPEPGTFSVLAMGAAISLARPRRQCRARRRQ